MLLGAHYDMKNKPLKSGSIHLFKKSFIKVIFSPFVPLSQIKHIHVKRLSEIRSNVVVN